MVSWQLDAAPSDIVFDPGSSTAYVSLASAAHIAKVDLSGTTVQIFADDLQRGDPRGAPEPPPRQLPSPPGRRLPRRDPLLHDLIRPDHLARRLSASLRRPDPFVPLAPPGETVGPVGYAPPEGSCGRRWRRGAAAASVRRRWSKARRLRMALQARRSGPVTVDAIQEVPAGGSEARMQAWLTRPEVWPEQPSVVRRVTLRVPAWARGPRVRETAAPSAAAVKRLDVRPTSQPAATSGRPPIILGGSRET
jgi:hypothetical protein